MNWDWEKLQDKRRHDGSGGPDLPDLGEVVGRLRLFGGPPTKAWSLALAGLLLLWLASGVYIVEPDELGVVTRFGAFSRVTPPGPHYHIPYPVERALTPKVSQVRRTEVGFRTVGRVDSGGQPQYRLAPEESLMLTGDENIVDIQFIVQYQIKDVVDFLFNVAEPDKTVKDAAEAAMREVVGRNTIDSTLTTGKLEIQTAARDQLQEILDRYQAGVRVLAVQLQDVHPPKDVVDAFKDVASAREDKNRLVNEAEAYRNDLLPRARGEAAAIENGALAYKESLIRRADGEAGQFAAVAEAWAKAPTVTSERMYIETMESILASPEIQKIILSDAALEKVVPYLPLDQFKSPRAAPAQPPASSAPAASAPTAPSAGAAGKGGRP